MRRVQGRTGGTMMAVTAALFATAALAFPSFASAAPTCDPSATMPDVHSGASQSTFVTCTDPSATGLNWASDPGDDAKHGFVSYGQDGNVYYTSNFDYKGPDSWTTQVIDNEGGTTDIAFSVDVVNQAPVCTAVTIDTSRNQLGFATPDCTDPDGD